MYGADHLCGSLHVLETTTCLSHIQLDELDEPENLEKRHILFKDTRYVEGPAGSAILGTRWR